MKIKVEVTQGDISDGVRGSPRYCPIALAVRRSGNTRAFVGGYRVSRLGGIGPLDPYGQSADLPSSARRFVACFDQGLVVDPISFELEIA